MELATEYGMKAMFFASVLDNGETVTICKLDEKDMVTTISLFAYLVANVPDVFSLFQGVILSTWVMEYQKIRDKATKDSGSILDEFKVEGKLHN